MRPASAFVTRFKDRPCLIRHLCVDSSTSQTIRELRQFLRIGFRPGRPGKAVVASCARAASAWSADASFAHTACRDCGLDSYVANRNGVAARAATAARTASTFAAGRAVASGARRNVSAVSTTSLTILTCSARVASAPVAGL